MAKLSKSKEIKRAQRTVAIVPFSVVEHGVRFRTKKQWWKKRLGSVNAAISMESGKVEIFDEDFVVAIFKKQVPKFKHFEIKKEVKV